MIPVYVLSLPADHSRYDALVIQMAGYHQLEPKRAGAIDGFLLPSAACEPLTRNKWSVNHKGTLACFMGHARIWEMIAESADTYALVLEDDVDLHNLDILCELRMPDDVDLIFCNDRMCYKSCDSGTMLLPVDPALEYIAAHGQAVGGDGYLLTRNGAQKLLAFVKDDSLFSHVDIRLLAYSLSLDLVVNRDLTEVTVIGNVLSMRNFYDISHRLNARVLSPYITRHHGGHGSRRAAADIEVFRAQ